MTKVLQNIKNIRKAKGISQESVAYDLGIDYSTYGKIERGQIALTIDRLDKIAQILGVNVRDVYSWGTKDDEVVSELQSLKEERVRCKMLIEHLKTELELTKEQLKDKDMIIKLLEKVSTVHY